MAELHDMWSSCWRHGTGPILFIVLPIGLLITTHLAYFELRYRDYSFWSAIKLASTPYVVIWVCIDIASMAGYLPERLITVVLGIALFGLFVAGPMLGRFMVKRTLKCSPVEVDKFFVHWSVANIILGILLAFAIPNVNAP